MSVTGREEGFTLLELMVVMTILVMVAALFPFALDHALPGRRVSTTAERLVSVVREAQGSSLLSGRPVAVRLLGHGLVTQDAATTTMIGRPLAFPRSTAVTLSDLEGRTVPALVVYPDGSAQAVRFELEDGGHRGAVLVSAMTGRVAVAAGH
jgi:type II secretion system protein H